MTATGLRAFTGGCTAGISTRLASNASSALRQSKFRLTVAGRAPAPSALACRHRRREACGSTFAPVWFRAAWRFRCRPMSSGSSIRATRRTHRHSGGLQFRPPVAGCSSPCVSTPATVRATVPACHRRSSAFWAARFRQLRQFFFQRRVIQFGGDLFVINACAHNLCLLLSLADDASCR